MVVILECFFFYLYLISGHPKRWTEIRVETVSKYVQMAKKNQNLYKAFNVDIDT